MTKGYYMTAGQGASSSKTEKAFDRRGNKILNRQRRANKKAKEVAK